MFIRNGGSARHEIRFTITGEADIAVLQHAHRGKVFSPDSALLVYRKFDGRDGPWLFDGVTVTGFIYRKNGTPGLLRGESYYGLRSIDDAPDWIRDLVKNNWPDPLLDALSGTLNGPRGGAPLDSIRRGKLRLALSRLTDEQMAVLATALTQAAPLVGEALSNRIAAGVVREQM